MGVPAGLAAWVELTEVVIALDAARGFYRADHDRAHKCPRPLQLQPVDRAPKALRDIPAPHLAGDH